MNTDLAVETAEKAKKEGVQQFLFMSSMIVYSGCKEKKITENTIPKPLNFYGDSKWQADQKIQALADERFKVVVLRPPMIYGKGSKETIHNLPKLAGKLPLFPIVHNQRSMLYIENLAQFVKRMIDNEETGCFPAERAVYQYFGSGADDRCGKRTSTCDGSSDWLDHPADEKDSGKNWHPDGQSVW